MKYVIILGDGMADEPIPTLGGKTPLEYANTPNIDLLALDAEIGMVHTIPEGMAPGSDTANLSVLGYNPSIYYTGRSPLEAMSMGVTLAHTDIALRCNLVTLSEATRYQDRVMIDHSAGEITTEEAEVLIEAVKNELETRIFSYFSGVSYRHLLVWHQGKCLDDLTPPHDILEKNIADYLPNEVLLLEMMEKSIAILDNHPINIRRRSSGLNPANSIWFWGAGTKPELMNFEQKYGKSGAMISAVDLLKGIAVSAGMKNIYVEGADGTLHTNYQGKATACLEALSEGIDFVYVHIEAPDEMGHQGNLENKIKAIALIDEFVVGPIAQGLKKMDTEYRLMILPDHPTPIQLRTHTNHPVPYLLYDSDNLKKTNLSYYENSAKNSSNIIYEGHKLIERLFQ